MPTRAAKPVTITLGPLTAGAQQMVTTGRYASMSEVVRAGLRALEREDAALNALMRERVRAALDDPAPSLPQEAVFAALRAYHDAER